MNHCIWSGILLRKRSASIILFGAEDLNRDVRILCFTSGMRVDENIPAREFSGSETLFRELVAQKCLDDRTHLQFPRIYLVDSVVV